MPKIIEISELSAPELAVYAGMRDAALRKQPEALFIAESTRVIGHALDAGICPVSFLMERRRIEGSARALLERCPDTPVYTAPDDVLEHLAGFSLSRGVFCAMERPRPRSIDEVCAQAKRVALLVDIVDPTNVGAILRSAAALGADAVLLSPSCCDPLHRRAVRVSMGSVFQTPWARLPADGWPEAHFTSLRRMGMKLAALALREDALILGDPRLAETERLALVLGTEGTGLPQALIEQCDFAVKIPMKNGVDSLNVAAASAVAFWALCR